MTNIKKLIIQWDDEVEEYLLFEVIVANIGLDENVTIFSNWMDFNEKQLKIKDELQKLLSEEFFITMGSSFTLFVTKRGWQITNIGYNIDEEKNAKLQKLIKKLM